MRTQDQVNQDVQTIEQTSKKWKSLMLFSVLVGLGSCGGMMMNDPDSTNSAEVAIGSFFFLTWAGSFLLFVYAKTMAWWHHK